MGPKLLKKGEKFPLDENCHHYTKLGEVPWDIQKYWHQRFSIFEFYAYDIHLTDSAWFGVTPEPVATRIARDLSTHPIADGKRVLIDLFGGAGGNVIAFALSSGRWDRIIAIEKDRSTLACAQHNAEVYDVLDKITWVHGDCFEVMKRFWKTTRGTKGMEMKGRGREGGEATKGQEQEDDNEELDGLLAGLKLEECLVFASPPWGGVSYRDQEVFDLSKMEPYNLEQLYEACTMPEEEKEEHPSTQKQKHILPQALFLPRQSDLNQIAALVPEGAPKIDVIQYCQKGASKALVAYLPGNIDADKEEKKQYEENRGQKKRKQDDDQEQTIPELLPEAPNEVSGAHDAYDTSYAQDIEADTSKADNAEKRKRKRRRRSSHNN
ncbi:hypothetical protein NEUTE2DRAFT_146762 [Neurospora tetrasperma FGSC 2509]|nr:hypothetical protein NEUTE2DRAFT_146762 [Neurospora tetrasperma FGSC 2509]